MNRLTSHNGIRGQQSSHHYSMLRGALETHFDKYLSLDFSSSREKTRPAYEFAWLLASNRIDECVHLANSTTWILIGCARKRDVKVVRRSVGWGIFAQIGFFYSKLIHQNDQLFPFALAWNCLTRFCKPLGTKAPWYHFLCQSHCCEIRAPRELLKKYLLFFNEVLN